MLKKNCYFIPHRLFLIHKMIPRRTSTINTDDTEETMMEVSEVSVIGMLARRLLDVYLIVLNNG